MNANLPASAIIVQDLYSAEVPVAGQSGEALDSGASAALAEVLVKAGLGLRRFERVEPCGHQAQQDERSTERDDQREHELASKAQAERTTRRRLRASPVAKPCSIGAGAPVCCRHKCIPRVHHPDAPGRSGPD
mgnify:CR=1 FL=1